MHNGILKTITAAAAIAYLGAACATESPEWQSSDLLAQMAVRAVSGLWLILFGIANDWFYEEWEEDEPWDM